jgi:phosphate transport system permease protein
MKTSMRRKVVNTLFLLGTVLCALVALVPLALILLKLVQLGVHSLSWSFLTEMPAPVGETGGGMANAIVGSAVLIALASAIGLPVGILGGVYLAEYGRGALAFWVRYMADLLSGTPSIVIGMFIYAILVLPVRQFSAWSGGVALGVMMVPTVMRTTEEMLKLVPKSLREASLALGIPQWRTIWSVVLTTGRAGIVTGALLAIARISGETAPLLFTAFGNRFWNTDLNQPMASLPLQIFSYAISPYEDWQAQAWAGALVLIALIFCLNVGARLFKRGY